MVEPGWPLASLVVGLTLAAAVVTALAGLGTWRSPTWASARAVVQLGLVSLVIGVALHSMVATLAFVVAMVVVAALTAGQRIGATGRRERAALGLPILAGTVPTVGAALASGAVPVEPVAVLPVAGILVGGAMSATTLAGVRLVEELGGRHDLYEAALALGATRRRAVLLVARPSAALALVPGLDQTRTVGLVTLPGAYVGVLLAGATPLEAGAAQILVLAGLLLTQAVATAATVELAARGLLRPPPPER